MASVFEKQFTKANKEVYADRGSRVAKQMTNSSEAYIKSLNDKLFSAEMAIDEMMDFSKSNTTSLDVKSPKSYEDFVEKLNKQKLEVALLKEELRVAEETHFAYFEDTEIKKSKTSEENKD